MHVFPGTHGPRLGSSQENPDLDGHAISNSNASNPVPSCADGQTQPYSCSGGESQNEPVNANSSEACGWFYSHGLLMGLS